MDLVRWYPNERVDLGDMEAGPGNSLVQDDQVREGRVMLLPSGRTTGQAVTSNRVLSGFALADLGGGIAQITRGTAILSLFKDGTLQHGILFGDAGAATVNVDFSGASNGDYDVHIRAVHTASDFENRVFWNPSGAPAQEFSDNVATRKSLQWEATFVSNGAAAPGNNGEYVKIWEVSVAAGAITGTTDFRHLFFEGSVPDSYAHEWGAGANDRNAARATYGVGDVHLWTQAVRTQLDQIIGKGGWYKKVGTSLNNAGYFVTVDQPGGPGGDGTYATLAAAVTALNAADGGTIILRAGTYDLTADITCTKCIRIVGVEDGVILLLNSGTTNHQLTFAAGADGSCLINVSTAEGAGTSEQAILVEDTVKRFQLIGCDITGTVTIAADAVIDNCTITGAATNANTGFALNFTGASAAVNVHVRNTRVLVGSNVAKAETVFVSQDGSYQFDNCRVTGNENAGDAPGIFGCSGGAGIQMSARDCDFVCAPFGARAAMDLVGDLSFDNCRWTIKAAVSDRFNAPVISLTSSAVFRGCLFDFGDYLCDGAAETDAPMYIAPTTGKVSFEHCRFTKMALTNATTNPNVDHFFNLNPSSGAQVDFYGCKVDDIDMQGSGSINMHLFGQSGSGSGSGRLQFKGCDFDGGGKTFRTVGDLGCMLQLSGSISNVKVIGCHFEGGTWNRIIDFVNQGAVFVGNTLDFSQSVSPDIEGPFIYLFGTASEVNDGYCVFSDNMILHESTIALDYAVRIQGYERVAVLGNVQINTGSALTYGIFGSDTINQGTMIGNNCDDGVQWGPTASGNSIPSNANLGTHNRMT